MGIGLGLGLGLRKYKEESMSVSGFALLIIIWFILAIPLGILLGKIMKGIVKRTPKP